MTEELYLVIHLGPAAGGGKGTPSASPLMVSQQGKGTLDGVAKGLEQSIVVYNGPVGWVACDRKSEEVKSLVRDAWADLAGWKMKLIEQKESPPSADSSGVENSIVNNSSFLSPYMLVYDSAHAGQPPRRETLPIREGVERILGRSRAEGRIVIDDRRVSRDHLRFYVEGGEVHVENLSQYPPTLEINGESTRITGRTRLVHKAKIKFGTSYVEFFNPLEVVPAAPAKARDSKTNAPTVPAGAVAAAPKGGAATVAAEGGGETVEQEGFDWVEKTLIVLAVLLVVWLIYFVFQFANGS